MRDERRWPLAELGKFAENVRLGLVESSLSSERSSVRKGSTNEEFSQGIR